MVRPPLGVLLANLALAAALTWGVVRVIAGYWAYGRMGTAGGNGMALTVLVLPVSLGSLTVTAVLTASIARGRPRSRAWAVAWSALALVIVAVTLLCAEAWRTADYPTEGDDPASMAAFLRHAIAR